MTFKTKASIWWGAVSTKTEEAFHKKKKRIVAHEYYDNPNPAGRPKSMHTISGSMRRSNSRGGSVNGSFRSNGSASSQQDMQDQGFQQQGYPDQGFQQQQGYPPQGYDQGYPQQGYPDQGYQNQGY